MKVRAILVSLVAAFTATAVAPVEGAVTGGCGAGAHGSRGYSYAGYQAARVARGVRATITLLSRPTVSAGHAAAWVGVGGPGQGPNGTTAWLQVGLAALRDTPTTIYVEIARPGRAPVVVPLLHDVAVGESHSVAVLELARQPGVWRVSLDGVAVTAPVILPGSSNRWRPIVTAESWNGGTRACNGFAFRFAGVALADADGGSWRPFEPGFRFLDRGYVLQPSSTRRSEPRSLTGERAARYAFVARSG